jgi:SAM-dependent methyltransferase
MSTIASGAQASAMLDREQNGSGPPYGRALDIGCGSGIWSVELARRGWDVTGIDAIPKAVSRARERAREAGIEVRFIEADVAELEATAAGSGFRLVLDFGTVHGLSPSERVSMGRSLTSITTDDATLLMYATSPGRRGPLPRGMSRADIEATYPGWKVTVDQAFDTEGVPGSFRRANPRWYRLQRA